MSQSMALLVVLLTAFTFAGPICAQPSSPEEPATTAGASAAQQTLDAMDTRVPVPLLPMMADHQKRNMREHLLAVQEIVIALAADDFVGIERAAARIGYSEQMGQMCSRMGAGASGFTEQALAFHRTADTIAEAARAHDRARVLGALGAALQKCTACHATFRQQIVDESTWSRMTATGVPMPHE